MDLQCVGHVKQNEHIRSALAALDIADEIPVNPGPVGQLLLAQAPFLAQAPDLPPQNGEIVAVALHPPCVARALSTFHIPCV